MFASIVRVGRANYGNQWQLSRNNRAPKLRLRYNNVFNKQLSERILVGVRKDLGESIIKHRFHIEMVEGTLCRSCFKRFIIQDILYLEKRLYLTKLAYLRFPNNDSLFERLIIGTEKELNFYNELFNDFNFKEYYGIMTDACESYVLFLEEIIDRGNLAEVIAVLLPCLWIFQEIRNEYRNKVLSLSNDNYYYKFLETYRDSRMSESTSTLKTVLDEFLNLEMNENNQELKYIVEEIIRTSLKHEYFFIESVYC